MKITIIGCGWLGLPLGLKLLKDGHQIFGSTTSESKLQNLTDSGINAFLYNGLENFEIPIIARNVDCVIINFPPSKSADYAEQIKSLSDQFPSDCKVVFTSSISVYENSEGDVDESGKLNESGSVYAAEKVIQNDIKPSVILRLAGLIGGERHPVKHLSGKTVHDSNMLVNLVHLDDVLLAIQKVLLSDKWNETYNVCYFEHPSKQDYYSKAALERSLPLPVFEFSQKVGKKVKSDKIEKDLDFCFCNPI